VSGLEIPVNGDLHNHPQAVHADFVTLTDSSTLKSLRLSLNL
jgi:hypothetical protein